ncbi:MAG: RluA family pseudouridine synthase [Planctomycetota bacterium]|nr:RluA family pseudouridine synthase [Planctomycetota bacterium]
MKKSYKERRCILSVSGKVEGRRIDSYLAARFNRYSRSFFQRLIAAGRVSLRGRKVKNSSVLQRGDEIEVLLPAIDKKILPQDLPLDILYEDEYIIAVNKDADSVVHPARGHWKGTLINAVFGRFEQRVENEDGFYPKVCHRIDKDTTGVILIGLTEKEHAAITRQFEERTVTKKYWAIVEGVVKPNRRRD